MSYNQTELRRQVAELLKRPENKECADCTERLPKWAVVNHGIFVCLNCSGQHRNIGAHISKVKSATLDDWEPEEVAFMAKMGNAKANAILLANLPAGVSKPQASDDRGRERWIKQKYVQRKWAGEPGNAVSQDQAPTVVQTQSISPSSNGQFQQRQQAQPQQPQPQLQQQQQYQQKQPQSVFPPSPTFASFTPAPQFGQTQPQTQPQPQLQQQNRGFSNQTSFDQLFNSAMSSPQPRPQQTGFSTSMPQNNFGQSYQFNQMAAQPRAQPQFTAQQPQQTSFGASQYNAYQQQPQQQQQQQPQQQVGMFLDFTGPAKPQPRPIDPNTKNQLLSCFGGSGSTW